MGKSLGNDVQPSHIIDEYGVDAFRYYFLRYIPSYGDGDYSPDRFLAAYNNELANELGNSVQRTAAMITQYQNGIIGNVPEAKHDQAQYIEAIEKCQFDRALDHIWEQVRGLNQYIDEEKPWTISKTGDKDHLSEVLAYQVSCLLEIANMLSPFLPETAQKIRYIFEEGIIRPTKTTLFPRKEIVPKSNSPVVEKPDGKN